MSVTMTLAARLPEMSNLTIPQVLEIADQQTKTYKSVAAAKAAARKCEEMLMTKKISEIIKKEMRQNGTHY